MIKVCDNKFKNAITLFKNYKIKESKKDLQYLITKLISLENSIAEKNQFAISLLPQAASLKKSIQSKLYEYNYFTYILNQNLFRNIQFSKNIILEKYAENFIFPHPYISFDDIYDTSLDPNKPTKKSLLDIFYDAQFTKYKALYIWSKRKWENFICSCISF